MRPKGPSEGNAKNWDAVYKELEAYHKEHGHSNVPSTLLNKLSRWVGVQRKDHRNEEVRMTAERIARLDKLDFRWATRRKVTAKSQRKGDESWREMYEKLKTYNEKHGHCRVPIQANVKDPDQSVLGSWVSRQRILQDRLPQSRKDLLDELDFLWVADNWDTMYEQLVKFRQEHSHTEVPSNNTSLAGWCLKQRGKMRQNKLTPERRYRMEEIGFNFELQSEKNERIWNAKLQRLKKYKRKHGNCFGPPKNASNSVEDKELVIWITHQRSGYKRGTIPHHRLQQLEEVGFVWSIVERGSQAPSKKQELAWEKSYEKLREFYEVHGHFTVPHVLENGDINPFNTWIGVQRKYFAQGLIKEDRRLKLEAIDFVWDQGTEHYSQRKWNAAFEDLVKFREEKGHTFVRRDDGMALWRWTEKMNWKRKRSTLSLKREQRLESIGFWDRPPPGYQERGEGNENSEEVDEDYSSSENDDNRKPTAKRLRTASVSEEDEEDFLSSKDEDDRMPTAKRRRTTSSSEEEDEEFRSSKNDDDCIHKTTAKRRRATSTSKKEPSAKGDDETKPMAKRRRTTSISEEEDEEFWSSNNDHKPTAKRRRTASTSEEEDEEELLSSKDSSEDEDDRKPKAMRYRGTSTSKKELSEEKEEDLRTAKGDGESKPMAKRRRTTSKQRRITSIPEEDDEDFWLGKDKDSRKPMAKGRRSTSASEDEDEEEFRSSEDDDDRKPKAKLRRAASADATDEYEEEGRISRSLLTRYSVGTKVKKFFEGYGWFLGEIASIDEEYCCYVRYEDGDEENYLLDELEDLNKIVGNVARTHPCK
jgi:hypothetical protein